MSSFSKWRLRHPDGYLIPKGPDISKAQNIRMQFDGNELFFRCPKHDPWNKCVESRYVSTNISLYHPHSYEESCSIGEIEGGNWFYRAISFYGPFLAGVIADLRVGVFIYRYKLSSEGQTFFDQTFFEKKILEYLKSQYLNETLRGEPVWVAPSGWSVTKSGQLESVRASAKSTENIVGTLREHLFAPIADDVMLCFSNRLSFSIGGNLDTQLEARDIKPLQELSNQILSSVSVKLSKQSKEQLAKAQAQFPTSKFSDHVAPLDWASTNQNDE